MSSSPSLPAPILPRLARRSLSLSLLSFLVFFFFTTIFNVFSAADVLDFGLDEFMVEVVEVAVLWRRSSGRGVERMNDVRRVA